MIALALFSFFMSALISRTVFERLPHLEDEVAYLYGARMFARGDLVIATPEPRRAFWQPFVVDSGGHRFSKYTPGWSMQLAIGELMGESWVINAFYAMLTVALVYRLGREIFNEDTGVIAAALTAFSPAALLLNGTLMGHTSALFATALFIYAYWRIEHGTRRIAWGAAAGVALGLLVINRPLTAAAVALPFVVWSGARLIRSLVSHARTSLSIANGKSSSAPVPLSIASDREGEQNPVSPPSLPYDWRGAGGEEGLNGVNGSRFVRTLTPLILLSVIAVVMALLIPIYNTAATGDPTDNLYTYVWSYDTVGFGACCGRTGHTLEKGIRHLRFDLSLTAADLFGFAAGSITPEVEQHWLTESDYFPMLGLSFVFFPLALIAAFRWKSLLVFAWAAVLVGWFALPYQTFRPYYYGDLIRDPGFAWGWLAAGLAWVNLPLLFWRKHANSWTWLLIAVMLTVVGMQIAYWIGSQRYSTRYYYEGLISAAILSAIPIAWLARRINRMVVYGAFALALAWSLFAYSVPRLNVLYHFNNVQRLHIEAVEARREGDRPVLVIINGDNVRWRAFGSLMAVTSPYLDSEIVVAHNYTGDSSDSVRERILALFPDRQVIEMDAEENQAWFSDEPPPE